MWHRLRGLLDGLAGDLGRGGNEHLACRFSATMTNRCSQMTDDTVLLTLTECLRRPDCHAVKTARWLDRRLP